VPYRIKISKGAARDLGALPANTLRRVNERIVALAERPRPDGVKKLSGMNDLYRIRVGDYRVIYEIQDAALVVIIIQARHRGEADR